MSAAPFRLEQLGAAHDRASFRSGEEALDRYLQTQATQDIRRHLANCFVAIEVLTGQIAGFYTLSAAGIALTDLPEEETRRLPRYPTLPAVRVGRLAVDQRFQGRGLGAALLADAAARAAESAAAAFALVVDAKSDRAADFYRHLGFMTLASHVRTLFLPIATAKKSSVEGRRIRALHNSGLLQHMKVRIFNSLA